MLYNITIYAKDNLLIEAEDPIAAKQKALKALEKSDGYFCTDKIYKIDVEEINY